MENLPSLNSPDFLGDNSLKTKFFSRKNVLYTIGVIIILMLTYLFFFSSPNNFPVEKVVNIKESSSLRSVSKYLQENHAIRSRFVFETFVTFFGGEKSIAPGDYLFEKKLSVFEVAMRITKGKRNLAPIKVTIPEGFNVSDISKAFSSKLPNFNEDKFLTAATAEEGYLFPDTYFFFTGDNEENVFHAMSSNFDKKILSILPQIALSGKSEKDIIIMASIIEKEAKGDSDRGYISGILWKRLALNMPLQVDADPNTYKTKGLPKSPIDNPGLKAIEAAIHPVISNYLYYLHDKEGSIHFAATFSEHKLNKQKYLFK